jgi:diaminopimelate epimerase
VFPGGKGDFEVEVDMGMPEFPAPRAADGGEISRHGKARITLEEETVEAVCLSMGNPHCVLFVPDVSRAPVAGLGSSLEKHPLFPQRTNVEFAQVENRGFIFLRVWERGVGETASCGTGACAAFVAAFETGLTDGNAVVALPGGNLRMHIDEFGHVYMRGPAVEVFHGKLNPSWLREEDGGNAGEG